MTKEELYWVAGILEGEGSFHATKHANKCRWKNLAIYCSMTDFDTIAKLYFTTGVGKVWGPRQRLGNKPYWTWCLQKQAEVFVLLTYIRPLMSQRRQGQIDVLLEHLCEKTLYTSKNAEHLEYKLSLLKEVI